MATFYFILAFLAVLAFLFFLGATLFSTEKGVGLGGLVATVLIFGLVTVVFSATTVDARSVGIATAFGRYQGTLKPGLQFTAPWVSVEEFTTRLQDTDLNDKDGSKNSVYVSFSAPKAVDAKGNLVANQTDQAGGGNGNISAVVRWQISDDQSNAGAKRLWEKYKTFDDVSNRLVLSESQEAVADIANDYTAGIASVNQTLIGDKVQENLAQRLRPYGIIVDSVSVKGVDLDGPTKASLQRIVDNINKTQAAIEEQKRAKVDNETAKLRQQTGALSKQANERYCLDIVNQWDVSKNGALPATFNCGLGATAGTLVQAK